MMASLLNIISKYGVPLFFIALFVYKFPEIKKAYKKWKKSLDEDDEEDKDKEESEKEDKENDK